MDRSRADATRVLSQMKKLASDISKSGVYSSNDVKIAVAYGNTITNVDGNKERVVQRIERVSLADARGKLDSVLPLALSKLKTLREGNTKSIMLLTDSTPFNKDLKKYESLVQTMEKEQIKFIPTFLTAKALGDTEENPTAAVPDIPSSIATSPVVAPVTIFDGQSEIPTLVTSLLRRVDPAGGNLFF